MYCGPILTYNYHHLDVYQVLSDQHLSLFFLFKAHLDNQRTSYENKTPTLIMRKDEVDSDSSDQPQQVPGRATGAKKKFQPKRSTTKMEKHRGRTSEITVAAEAKILNERLFYGFCSELVARIIAPPITVYRALSSFHPPATTALK